MGMQIEAEVMDVFQLKYLSLLSVVFGVWN